jgi:mono/diheme cytochrome c family protein
MPPRHNAEGHTWHHADCDLLEIIAEGLPDRPGLPDDVPTMPAFGEDLEVEDQRAVLAFIKTWWTSDQRSSQQQATEQVCNASS